MPHELHARDVSVCVTCVAVAAPPAVGRTHHLCGLKPSRGCTKSSRGERVELSSFREARSCRVVSVSRGYAALVCVEQAWLVESHFVHTQRARHAEVVASPPLKVGGQKCRELVLSFGAICSVLFRFPRMAAALCVHGTTESKKKWSFFRCFLVFVIHTAAAVCIAQT